jgi:hypothetical protein
MTIKGKEKKMEMQITIEDYLDKDDIVEIIRYRLDDVIRKDSERILSNTAYAIVFEAVDKALDNKAKDIIKEKVLDCINNLSEFDVFRRANAWDKESSVGQEIVDKALVDNTSEIYGRVKSAIDSINIEGKIEEKIEDSLEDILLTALKKGLTSN